MFCTPACTLENVEGAVCVSGGGGQPRMLIFLG